MSIEAANAETTRIAIAENTELKNQILELERQIRQFAVREEMRKYAEEHRNG